MGEKRNQCAVNGLTGGFCMSGLGDSSGIYLEAKTGTVKFPFFLVFSCRKQLSFPYVVDIIDWSFWRRPTSAYGFPTQGLPTESLNSIWEGSYWTTSIASFVLNAHPPSTYPPLLENLPTCLNSTLPFYHSTTMITANTKLNIHNM